MYTRLWTLQSRKVIYVDNDKPYNLYILEIPQMNANQLKSLLDMITDI